MEKEGYEVVRSIEIIKGTSEAYQATHTDHYKKITEADVLFVLNPEKDGVANYIGPSVFAEIAFAIGLNIALGKKVEIFCLNPLPKNLPYSDELEKWEMLGWIRFWEEK